MDSELVVRAQRGDEQAFASLPVMTYPRLLRVAQGILRDATLAEDATAWLNGAGDCDGWSYVAHYAGLTGDMEVRGLSQPGETHPRSCSA